jgi:hypothetical protein
MEETENSYLFYNIATNKFMYYRGNKKTKPEMDYNEICYYYGSIDRNQQLRCLLSIVDETLKEVKSILDGTNELTDIVPSNNTGYKSWCSFMNIVYKDMDDLLIVPYVYDSKDSILPDFKDSFPLDTL